MCKLLNRNSDTDTKFVLKKTTLDIIIRDFAHNRNVKFVKIDVEGHELNILNGALNLVSRNKTIFMLEINHGALSQSDLGFKDIFEFFTERSYKVFWIHSHSADLLRVGRSPSLLEVKDYNQLENIYADIIAVPSALNV